MYRLCLPKSRFEGALYRVLLPWRADDIYRTPLATVTEFIGESLMTFSASRAVTFIDTLLSLFTRAARFHFRYLYGPVPSTLSRRRFNGQSARSYAVRIVIAPTITRSREIASRRVRVRSGSRENRSIARQCRMRRFREARFRSLSSTRARIRFRKKLRRVSPKRTREN